MMNFSYFLLRPCASARAALHEADGLPHGTDGYIVDQNVLLECGRGLVSLQTCNSRRSRKQRSRKDLKETIVGNKSKKMTPTAEQQNVVIIDTVLCEAE